jgi:YD repeat-containing protein
MLAGASLLRAPAQCRCNETNANHEIIQYTYSSASDVVALTDGKGQTTLWNYDIYGRVSNKVDQASAVILVYAYDAANRLTNRWSAARGNTGYLYDPLGNVIKVDCPISLDVTFGYDQLNRVTNMVDAVGTALYTYTGGNQLLRRPVCE